MKQNIPDISFIIPVFNVELFLKTCLESISSLSLSNIEIILINDGSTDTSGKIADDYAKKDNRIRVFHQKNSGLSATRNRGIELAQGFYIAFIDSDDWLIDDHIVSIYKAMKKGNADIGMGNLLFCYQDGIQNNPFANIPTILIKSITSGKTSFVELMKNNSYPPMVCNYLYRREWLIFHKLRFLNVLHEDELWTPVALCKAERVVVTDIDFYRYRQRDHSIMTSLRKKKRIRDLLFIADQLIHFAERELPEPADREVKSWLYSRCYLLYKIAFCSLSHIQDSRFLLPSHHLYQLFAVRNKFTKEARTTCIAYYRIARHELNKYRRWRLSELGKTNSHSIPVKTRLILIYNTMWEQIPDIPVEEIPPAIFITTDRRFLPTADFVVFHLPDLSNELEDDLDKPDGQKWVAWSLECEENYPFLKDSEFMELFDYKMSYHQDADIIYPYYRYEYRKDLISTPEFSFHEKKDICMMIPTPSNQNEQQEYLQELMQYIQIDSYEELFNTYTSKEDTGQNSKIKLYNKYKFVIAFENCCAIDYVTEKFYDPLLAGAVPIYLGAPNIEAFVPGENCFVDIRMFSEPKQLATFLSEACQNEDIYNQFLRWKKEPLKPEFLKKTEEQRINPFIRLCSFLQ